MKTIGIIFTIIIVLIIILSAAGVIKFKTINLNQMGIPGVDENGNDVLVNPYMRVNR